VLAMKFSLRMKGAATIHHVAHVSLVRSNVKVRRVAARLVIAAVAALKALRNGAIGVLPSKTMCDFWSGAPAVGIPSLWMRSEPPISSLNSVPKPRPTLFFGSFLDLSPESFFRWGFGHHNYGEHNPTKGVSQCPV
jgi:hypothetical protein